MSAAPPACTAERFSEHDHSLPPHNTPATARASATSTACQANSSRFDWEGPPRPCTDTRDYEVVVYQPGTHEWVRMFTCTNCAGVLFLRHSQRGGPAGTRGIAWLRDLYRQEAS